MIAVYNNNEYRLISKPEYKKIVTRQQVKADDSFVLNGIYYSKKVDAKELSDVFEVRLWAKYHTEFDDVSDWWDVSSSRSFINDRVELLFDKGFLPEWEKVDKNVCHKMVSASDLTSTAVVFTYIRKDGIVREPPVRVEKQILVCELERYNRQYCTNLEI